MTILLVRCPGQIKDGYMHVYFQMASIHNPHLAASCLVNDMKHHVFVSLDAHFGSVELSEISLEMTV